MHTHLVVAHSDTRRGLVVGALVRQFDKVARLFGKRAARERQIFVLVVMPLLLFALFLRAEAARRTLMRTRTALVAIGARLVAHARLGQRHALVAANALLQRLALQAVVNAAMAARTLAATSLFNTVGARVKRCRALGKLTALGVWDKSARLTKSTEGIFHASGWSNAATNGTRILLALARRENDQGSILLEALEA